MSAHDLIECRSCKGVKAKTEFHVDMQKPTGRCIYCKECRRKNEGPEAKARAAMRRNAKRVEREEAELNEAAALAGKRITAPVRRPAAYAPLTITATEHAYA